MSHSRPGTPDHSAGPLEKQFANPGNASRLFVPRQQFAAMSRNAPSIDIETFRTDQEAAIDHEAYSPYGRRASLAETTVPWSC